MRQLQMKKRMSIREKKNKPRKARIVSWRGYKSVEDVTQQGVDDEDWATKKGGINDSDLTRGESMQPLRTEQQERQAKDLAAKAAKARREEANNKKLEEKAAKALATRLAKEEEMAAAEKKRWKNKSARDEAEEKKKSEAVKKRVAKRVKDLKEGKASTDLEAEAAAEVAAKELEAQAKIALLERETQEKLSEANGTLKPSKSPHTKTNSDSSKDFEMLALEMDLDGELDIDLDDGLMNPLTLSAEGEGLDLDDE